MEQDSNLKKLEAKILEQEHRPFRLVWNFITRKKKYNQNDPRRKAVTKAIIWRLFVSPASIAVTLSGILGYFTLIFMKKQNSLIERQNKIIEGQASLIEGTSRSSQMTLLNNLMKDMNKELKKDSFSKLLKVRITALSHIAKPYKVFDFEENDISQLISPERGKLFQLLLLYKKNGLKISDSLLVDSDFKYSDLKNQWLMDIDASNCKLKFSSMDSTLLHNSTLIDTDLRYSHIKNSGFINSNMKNIDLRGSKFVSSNLTEANLENADLRGTVFINMNLAGIKSLDGAKVENKNWFNSLRADSLKNTGIDELELKYEITPVYNKDMKKDIFTLLPLN